MVFMTAVRATVKAPCNGICPWKRLADFLAVIRYFIVGTVVEMTITGGANTKIRANIGSIIFQKSSSKLYAQ